jgi:hypothetical protein
MAEQEHNTQVEKRKVDDSVWDYLSTRLDLIVERLPDAGHQDRTGYEAQVDLLYDMFRYFGKKELAAKANEVEKKIYAEESRLRNAQWGGNEER